VSIGFGVVKEIIDLKWDWKDMLADVIGIIVSDIIIAILIAL